MSSQTVLKALFYISILTS